MLTTKAIFLVCMLTPNGQPDPDTCVPFETGSAERSMEFCESVLPDLVSRLEARLADGAAVVASRCVSELSG